MVNSFIRRGGLLMSHVIEGRIRQLEEELVVLLLLVAADTVGNVFPLGGRRVKTLLDVGTSDDGRRCLTKKEMGEKRFRLNSRGAWSTSTVLKGAKR